MFAWWFCLDLVFAAFLTRHAISNEIIHGDISVPKRTQIFSRFQNEPDPRVMVIQPQSAAHGVTLTAADTVVFWGPVMSTETYIQCCARSDRKGQDSAIYVITMADRKVKTVLDTKKMPALQMTNGLLLNEEGFLIFVDMLPGILYRLRLADGTIEKLAEGFEGGDGLAWDFYGRLFISSWKLGKLWVIPRPGVAPILLAEGFESAADICLDPTGKWLIAAHQNSGSAALFKVDAESGRLSFTGTKVQVPGSICVRFLAVD